MTSKDRLHLINLCDKAIEANQNATTWDDRASASVKSIATLEIIKLYLEYYNGGQV